VSNFCAELEDLLNRNGASWQLAPSQEAYAAMTALHDEHVSALRRGLDAMRESLDAYMIRLSSVEQERDQLREALGQAQEAAKEYAAQHGEALRRALDAEEALEQAREDHATQEPECGDVACPTCPPTREER
jgi:hypothetical protein